MRIFTIFKFYRVSHLHYHVYWCLADWTLWSFTITANPAYMDNHEDVIKWNIFRVTGLLWGESNGYQWIPLLKASARGFYVSFDLRLNKLLNKQSRRRWFETPSHSL